MEEKNENTTIKITYETLFEILQREKNRGELQKLEDTFFADVKKYLIEKIQLSNQNNAQSQLFDEQAKLKALHEVTNIKKIIKEIYQKRERKIIDLSLTASRTFNTIKNPNLLPEEKQLHDNLLATFDKNRKTILHTTITPNTPLQQFAPQPIQTATQVTTETIQETQATTKKTEKNTTQQPETTTQPTKTTSNTTIMLRFKEPVSQFVGKQLESYGPYEKEDIATIPEELAQILITKQKAEIISTN
jgi:DNA replication initiation complex subunit (GINS family)